MQLHEFMNSHRDEILTACDIELEHSEHAPQVRRYIAQFFDEMLRALRRDSGIPESYSPLPGESDTAARLGADHQRAGVPVTKVAAVFSAISQAVAKTGELYELSITAEEYKLLNKCLDAGIATSIEKYWQRDKSEVNQRITERYGHMAHELRNALGNANMAIKLMRAGDLEIRGRTGEVLARNMARMGSLIAQCLGSIQVEVGKPPPLGAVLVASVLRDLEASALPDRGVSIVLEVDEVLFIEADEMLLASAVGNLVDNAVKFSRSDAVVRVGAWAEGDAAVIEVDDECGGLGKDELCKLCEPYSTRRMGSRKGLGLGLAITKQALEAMNGEMRVIDRPGQGCTFRLSFPLLRPC
jgi:signal transduction histidine kinase